MSTILEHFKPPPLASDPPAKTRFWPAPPKGTTGGILQRPKPESNISITVSASSSSSVLSVPAAIPPSSPSVASSRVSFAPLPDLATRKRRNSITLGVAARSAALRKIKEQRGGGPPPNAGPQPNASGGAPAGAGPRPPNPQPHPRSNSASLGRRSGGGGMQYMYPYQAGQPRARRPSSKDDQVVDLGEVAIDAGKKFWRAVSGKKEKGRKSSSAASDSGRPDMGGERGVGGPTVGASGHNTEREILVRGFAVPEEVVDEEDEEANEETREEDAAETQAEAQHRTEDYVAGIQNLQLYDDDAEGSEIFTVDPSAVSSTETKATEGIEPSAIHSTRLSPPPPPLTPESEVSDLTSADESLTSSLTSPNVMPRSIDDPPNEHLAEPKPQPPVHSSSLF